MTADADDDGPARRWLTPGQIGALREACYRDDRPGIRQRRDDAVVTLLYDAALRAEELVRLDVDDLRERSVFLAADLQVPDATNPSPTTRRVTLADDTIRTLNAHLDGRSTDASALFLGADGRITVPEIRRLVRDAAEAADVAPHHVDGSCGAPADVTPETVRHSTAWRMLNGERGASLYDVQSRMRHASLDATKRVYGDFADA